MKARNTGSYTVVLIPDADQAVRRFQLKPWTITAAALMMAAVAAIAVLSTLLLTGKSEEVASLKIRLAEADARYESAVGFRDGRIETLQAQLVGLSEEADTFRERMREISRLELQVKEMVGITPGQPAVIIDGEPSDGAGGAELPVTAGMMDAYVSSAFGRYSEMTRLAAGLSASLEETRLAVLEEQAELRVTPSIWPTTSLRVTSMFGVRSDPFTGRARLHGGIDIGGSTGDPIYATADGTVVTSGRDRAEGLNIHIDHGNGFSTKYMHLSKLLAEEGTVVQKGDVIGLLGSTGRSTGPHLHYEVLLNGERQDPAHYMGRTIE